MKYLQALILFILIPLSLFSQNNYRITGVVKDQKTGMSLEYAHVGILNRAIGTVTNSKGEFSLLVPDGTSELTISYIGYENATFNLDETNSSDVEILLIPSAISLPDLIISNKKRNIIEEAVELIPLNHDLGDMKIRGFWRAQMNNTEEIIQLSETVFDIFRFGDDSDNGLKKTTELSIIKGRISRDSASFDSLRNIQAGVTPKSVFGSSFLVTSKLLSKKTIRKHNYEIVDVVNFNGRSVFVVDFSKKEKEKTGYEGQIYLDAETLAFVKIVSQFSSENEVDIKLFQGSKLAGRLVGLFKSTWDTNHADLTFQNVNGMWYLSHGRFEADWTLINESQNLNEPVSYAADFVITEIKKKDYIIPPKEKFANQQILERQAEYGNEDFWEDYNILEPDQNFEQLFLEIKEKNIDYSRKKVSLETEQ